MAQVVKELSVCSDCFMHVATGDEPERFEVVKGVIELSDYGYVVTGNESYGFCFPPCECCKSKLAGDRFQVLVLN